MAVVIAYAAACGGSGAAPLSVPSEVPAEQASSDPQGSALHAPPPYKGPEEPTLDLTVGTYSADDARAAYRAALDAASAFMRDPQLMAPRRKVAGDFESVTSLMSTYLLRKVEPAIASYVAPGEAAPASPIPSEDELALDSVFFLPSPSGTGPSGTDSEVSFTAYDDARGAFGDLSFTGIEVYDFRDPVRGEGLVVLFNMTAQYNVLTEQGPAVLRDR